MLIQDGYGAHFRLHSLSERFSQCCNSLSCAWHIFAFESQLNLRGYVIHIWRQLFLRILQNLYEELLKKESEISTLKLKARQLMVGHENSAGYTEMKQQLQLLG